MCVSILHISIMSVFSACVFLFQYVVYCLFLGFVTFLCELLSDTLKCHRAAIVITRNSFELKVGKM